MFYGVPRGWIRDDAKGNEALRFFAVMECFTGRHPFGVCEIEVFGFQTCGFTVKHDGVLEAVVSNFPVPTWCDSFGGVKGDYLGDSMDIDCTDTIAKRR